MTILITIVSKQTIPNILFIKEKQAEVDKFLFVNTKETLKEKERIIAVCGIAEKDCISVEVVEDDITDMAQKIEAKLKENMLSEDARFLVHITGGTKPMSLGVFSFFEKKKNAEFYYITFPNTIRYQRLYTDRPPEYFQLNYRISLKDYLLAYGFNIASRQTELIKDFQYTKDLTLSSRKKARDEITSAVELLQNQGNLSGKERNYYESNGYFEEYIYSVVKEQLNLNDDQIGLSVKTQQPLIDNAQISDHEIDVMLVYENHLHIIECKTGLKTRGADGKLKDIFEESVFRIYAIKQRIGFSNGYIATLQGLRELDGTLKTKYAKKAKPSNITVLDNKDIKQETGLLKAIEQIKNKHRNI